ncbi:mechanosensitive ion channel family protein [Aureispira anguillae]|uniref:Mechanosensitive ion channel family protein n=1 Tax=Aureispira anguillae TaxID=2864201 RepID=A0A915YI91_9BACT|nr:mechanosensitive ion channel family protein [Aureispira anguillae]BDS13678.1 mechanosensitive ion channel family protein [Aureispira anguillae]
MDVILEWFHQFSDGLTETESKGLTTFIIVLLLWLFQRLMVRSIMKLQNDLAIRYTWRKSLTYGVYLIGIVAIALVWANHFGDFATYLGLLSAGLAIAFQDPIVNMAGWYFILLQKPFKVGDRIQVDNQIGDVVDINLFQFSIVEVGNWVGDEQSTGRIIHIPNSKIFKTPLANYNEGLDYIWNEIKVLVTFESNWKKCKEVLENTLNVHAPKVSEHAKKELQSASGKYLIYYHKVTPIVYTSVEDSGVLLTLRYLCEPKKRRNTTSFLWEKILDEFNHPDNIDMDFAYPTRRAVTTGDGVKAATGD